MQNLPPQIDQNSRPVAIEQHSGTAELQWWTTLDQVEHPVRIWSASAQSAVVFYLHGIEGHGLWFEKTALALNKKGISVYALDRRGAGSSKQLRGHAPSWKRLVADADELLAETRKRNPNLPCFLVANCWGAKVALAAAALSNNSSLAGLVLTSPAVCVQVDVPPLTKLMIGLSLLFGGKHSFDVPLTPEHFTDVPEYLEYIRNDSLRLTKATAAFFVESVKLTHACKSASRGLKLPILILQSGRDGIVNVEEIKKWFEGLSSTDKSLMMFPEMAHSLDFDYRAKEYQDALASWILDKSRLANAQHELASR